MSQYAWCEDSKSGLEFWKAIFKVINPEIIVETKNNNTNLRKSVDKISDDGNEYYILMDNAIDNPDVLREVKKLKECIAAKHNVYPIKIHSFEFSLLSFKFLEEWVFAEKDELKDKRRNLLDARKTFIDIVLNGRDATLLAKLKADLDFFENKNTEQISAKLLTGITLNTGFETDKKKLGTCFINNCCEWVERQMDDICGLDDERIQADEKVKQIVKNSVLKDVFQMEANK